MIAFRWRVERTFAWLDQCRLLAKDYEKTVASAEAWIWTALSAAERVRPYLRLASYPFHPPMPKPIDLPPAPALEDSPFVAESRRRFLDFLAALPSGEPIAVLCHSDADGLAAGAVLARGLERTGRRATALATGKVGNAWTEETREKLLALTPAPAALVVTDLGVRLDPVLGEEVPTFFIDHHRPGGGFTPEAAAADPRIVTGYGVEPTPCSALLALACVEALDPALGGELDWIAALGTLSDLGDRAPFPFLAAAKKRHGATLLRDATSLLNAPRRAAAGDASPALALLLRAHGPRDILTLPEAAALRAAKAEVAAAYAEAKKGAPKFTRDKRVAAVCMDTPCQVHPLVAQIWRTRFPHTIVMGVNTGFRPGFVHFSARCGKDTNLLDFFRQHRPVGADPNHYGNGHDQAGGGALPVPVWNAFARDLGFGDEMQVVGD